MACPLEAYSTPLQKHTVNPKRPHPRPTSTLRTCRAAANWIRTGLLSEKEVDDLLGLLFEHELAYVRHLLQLGGVRPSSQGDAEVIAESIEPRAPVPSGGFVRREGEAPINQMVSFIREGRQRAGIATGADRRVVAAVASERREERRRQLAAERAAREEQRREAAVARAERAAKRARRD